MKGQNIEKVICRVNMIQFGCFIHVLARIFQDLFDNNVWHSTSAHNLAKILHQTSKILNDKMSRIIKPLFYITN